ncbi:MAG: hypothetical protein HN849_34335, partial [Victivallales bacterium]|nr:hypothetical protein [Victivallales bacterium]
MRTNASLCLMAVALAAAGLVQPVIAAEGEGILPAGTRAVWDLGKAQREASTTRERVCIDGLWRWQPADGRATAVPTGGWGYFKVPGSWPGIGNWMQKDSQTVHFHPTWKDVKMAEVAAAWYEREIIIPKGWAGRRITVSADYINSYAIVFVDGKKAGELGFPGGELDLTSACRPGSKQVLSMRVLAMPLKQTMLSFNDSNSARGVKGSVARRGLCGDVYLNSTPAGPRIAGSKVDTSVRKWEITASVNLEQLAAKGSYVLRAQVSDGARRVAEFRSRSFGAEDLVDGRLSFTHGWHPEKLWDIHTPGNLYQMTVSLLSPRGALLDEGLPTRFGFREFWIDGRDFYLNGTRLFLSAIPFDNAQVSAGAATYAAALETMKRMQTFGINFVYTHNYDCNPGSYLGFAEILRAADDAGMLVALSQPHFGHYDWKAPDADEANGYAGHAAFFMRAAQDPPSVVAYSPSHNACGYADDMNPQAIDGLQNPRDQWSQANARKASRAEAIIKRIDPARIVYHHSSGNLGSMHTANFYPNFVPIQELSDWFEHWATEGVKPVFTVEYAAPFPWDFAMYRGWYHGARNFGSAVVPWELCLAEWNAQFFGDKAYALSEVEKRCLRWEAKQFRAGQLWHRWDYPHEMGSRDFGEQYPAMAMYTTDNWRAFRTWGMSANSPWSYAVYWQLRDGVDQSRKEVATDWDNLQRPGFSPDYIEGRFERMVTAFEFEDWVPTVAAKALLRNNMPLLAYIAGEPGRFTSKDHVFHPGDTVEKQLIVINNSRQTVSCDGQWALSLPQPQAGREELALPTGEQKRIPLRFTLPDTLKPGQYTLAMTTAFGTGEKQDDTFAIRVVPRPAEPKPAGKIALFDPQGETGALLRGMGLRCETVRADADLSPFDVLVIGRRALTVDGPSPDVSRVKQGLHVVVFEQTAAALEKRLGFRVVEYGLRQVFRRLPDHPALAGIDEELLRDWRGEATLLPPQLEYEKRPGEVPQKKWCGIDIKRLWRAGGRGNVASVLIEKPGRGDFMPIVDGGYSLQYSPLLEYREGKGMVLFCQLDVTARSITDPVAETVVRSIMRYVSERRPKARRSVLYAGKPAGKRYLDANGFSPTPFAGGALSPD